MFFKRPMSRGCQHSLGSFREVPRAGAVRRGPQWQLVGKDCCCRIRAVISQVTGYTMDPWKKATSQTAQTFDKAAEKLRDDDSGDWHPQQLETTE